MKPKEIENLRCAVLFSIGALQIQSKIFEDIPLQFIIDKLEEGLKGIYKY